MSNRKYASGFENWKKKKKRRIEKVIQSQQGALHKFVIIHKKDVTTSSTHTNMTKNSPLKIPNNINTVEQNTDNENIQEVENLNNMNSPNPSQEQEDNENLEEDSLETNKERKHRRLSFPPFCLEEHIIEVRGEWGYLMEMIN